MTNADEAGKKRWIHSHYFLVDAEPMEAELFSLCFLLCPPCLAAPSSPAFPPCSLALLLALARALARGTGTRVKISGT